MPTHVYACQHFFNSSFSEWRSLPKLARTYLTAFSANVNTFLSLNKFLQSLWKCQHISKLANTVYCSLWERQHISKLINTILTSHSANANTFVILPKLFNSSFWGCQHISMLANTFLTAFSANDDTFLNLLALI